MPSPLPVAPSHVHHVGLRRPFREMQVRDGDEANAGDTRDEPRDTAAVNLSVRPTS